MPWVCPQCRSKHLDVVVQVTARLEQSSDGNFETDLDNSDHEWGADSAMTCRDCGTSAPAAMFEEESNED